MNEPRNSIVSVELIQDSEIKSDPLELMWANYWMLSDVINRLGLYAYNSVDIIHHQRIATNPDESQTDLALRAIANATMAIRQLAVRELFKDGEPQQIVFVYMGAMYGVTAIKDSK